MEDLLSTGPTQSSFYMSCVHSSWLDYNEFVINMDLFHISISITTLPSFPGQTGPGLSQDPLPGPDQEAGQVGKATVDPIKIKSFTCQ